MAEVTSAIFDTSRGDIQLHLLNICSNMCCSFLLEVGALFRSFVLKVNLKIEYCLKSKDI